MSRPKDYDFLLKHNFNSTEKQLLDSGWEIDESGEAVRSVVMYPTLIHNFVYTWTEEYQYYTESSIVDVKVWQRRDDIGTPFIFVGQERNCCYGDPKRIARCIVAQSYGREFDDEQYIDDHEIQIIALDPFVQV